MDAEPPALTPVEIAALHEALDDEFRAWATYDQVIRDFGEVRPFVNIRDAEARHIDALRALFRHYGQPVPANAWPRKTPRFSSVQDACAAGVAGEIENVALYERLMASTERLDILAVYRKLQYASKERHLPAFRRCAERRGRGNRAR